MERNVSFETAELKDIVVHLAWGQLEIFGAETEKIQVMAAGDENAVNDLRIDVKEGSLTIEQPQYGISLNLMDSRWLQLCVRVPMSWKRDLHCTTLSGLLSARKLGGGELAFETVSGELKALKLSADALSLKTVSGDIRAEELAANKLSVRSVTGDIALDAVSVKQLKSTSIGGEQTFNMTDAFHRVDVNAVSGNVTITAPVAAINAALRSISGKMLTEAVDITENADAPVVRITGISADLKLINIKE